MSTENELKEFMGLVGAFAQDTALYMRDVVQINKVETSAKVLEDRLRALLAELDAAREDAARWKHVLQVIGAQTQLGRANFVVVGLDAPMNVMRGSVAEHFTKAIDAARKGEA